MPIRSGLPRALRLPRNWSTTCLRHRVVSIAGGEPLLHKEIAAIAAGIVARRKFVYLCTNALLLQKRLHLFQPSPYFVWSVHLDGDREMHDHSVCEEGVYERTVAAIRP